MKKIISLLLVCVMTLSACGEIKQETPNAEKNLVNSDSVSRYVETQDNENESQSIIQENNTDIKQSTEDRDVQNSESENADREPYEEEISFETLDDPDLSIYIQDSIYSELVESLNSDEYFVENVSAVYISQEYIDELSYNSRSNIFFGYTLSELDEAFQGNRYVFTLGDEGDTVVTAFEDYDDTYEKALKNVAIGAGVILVCVTVSVVTGGAGAAAVSVIFATAAKTGTIAALSSGALGGVAAGIVTEIQTGDMEEAKKAAALAASEGFKWGAITGAISGGATEAIALKGATCSGLTMNEAATIQKETKWPLDAIKNLHSYKEYEIYKAAGLTPTKVNGSWALIRNIDWNATDSFGRTNIARVERGIAPIDSNGISYELHHIGMNENSPLAILTNEEHHLKETYSILHYAEEGKNITDSAWAAQKKTFWKEILELARKTGGI